MPIFAMQAVIHTPYAYARRAPTVVKPPTVHFIRLGILQDAELANLTMEWRNEWKSEARKAIKAMRAASTQ